MVLISELPDVVLWLIFSHLPLAQLFASISLVCTNWARVLATRELITRKELVLMAGWSRFDQEGEVKNFQNKKQREVNHIGSVSIYEALRNANVENSAWAQMLPISSIEFNLLRIRLVDGTCTITEDITNSIVNNLTGITQLTLSFRMYDNDKVDTSLKEVIRIIDQYRDQLVSLKLGLEYGSSRKNLTKMEEIAQGVFDSINKIGAQLEHVTLNMPFHHLKLLSGRDNFAFLARVQSFSTDYFCMQDNADKLLLSSLAQHATGGACKQIDIDRRMTLKEAIGLVDPELNAKIRHLTVETGRDTDETISQNMRLFGHRFASLSSLELLYCKMPITKIARHLSRMSGLVHLKIDYTIDIPKFEEENTEAGPLAITRLPSVRMLSLKVDFKTHSDMEKMHLGQIFSGLQVLQYLTKLHECKECKIEHWWGDLRGNFIFQKGFKAKKANCARITLQSFARSIPSLQLVEHKPSWGFAGENHEGLHNLDQLSKLVESNVKYMNKRI